MSIIDLKHINPGWDTGEEKYQINCINCAVATDAFLRGFTFEAKPAERQRFLEVLYKFYDEKIIDSDELECSSLNEMLDRITTVPERGFVIISPTPNSLDCNDSSKLKIRSTHIVNIVLMEKIIYILDGQRNLVFRPAHPPPNYLPNRALYSCLSININDNSHFSDVEKIKDFCILS